MSPGAIPSLPPPNFPTLHKDRFHRAWAGFAELQWKKASDRKVGR